MPKYCYVNGIKCVWEPSLFHGGDIIATPIKGTDDIGAGAGMPRKVKHGEFSFRKATKNGI